MLESWALTYHGFKKRIAMLCYQRRDLRTAALFVATSESEAASIRDCGLKQPIAIIPNGVDIVSRGEVHRTQFDGRSHRTALFLSRIHPKKGLLNLISAWGKLRPTDWRLVIAGPDEGGHLAELKKAVLRQGIEEFVEFIGEVNGEAKSAAYRAADLFVLPTFSENFGIVVAEALAHGLPVITTRGAPWADLQHYRCGWWIDVGVDPLVDALREAISLSDAERKAMGERGKAYVRRYDWNDIARQTVDVYRWVLGQGPKPECVNLD